MESYLSWIHILFFSTWLGGNLFCLVIFLPASASLPPNVRAQLRGSARHGLNIVTIISAPLVVLSGAAPFLLSALGFGAGRRFSVLIAGKALLTLVMVANHLLQAFRYGPASTPGGDPSALAAEAAWIMWVRLLALNVILGFIIFFLGLSLV